MTRVSFIAFVVGYLAGVLIRGIAVQLRAGMDSAPLGRELARLRAENAALRSLAYDDWLLLHPDVPADEAAARFDLAVAVRAAGLARGDGDISGDLN